MKILRLVALACLFPLSLLATVTSQVDKTGPFLITSVPQTIPTGFPFVSGSELLVLDTGPTGSPYDPARVLTLGSDYTVTGGNYNSANQMLSGSIVVVGTGTHAVAANDYLVIMRKVPINQTSSFITTGPLTVTLIEQALDKMATLSQQVNEIGNRSLQFENFEFLSGTLVKSVRSGKLLGFGSTGLLAWYDPSSIAAGTVVTSSLVLPDGTSTTRTLGALFGDYVSVKDFGAKGDGVTDDTAAIQAAVNAVPFGGKLYFPHGTYIRSATVTLPNGNITLEGDGNSSIIKDAASAVALPAVFGGSSINGIVMRNLAFLGNAALPVTIGTAEPAISIQNSTDLVFDHLYLSNYSGAGISLASCPRPTIQYCRFYNMGQPYAAEPPGTPALPCINVFPLTAHSGDGGKSGANILYNSIENASCVGISLYANDGKIIGNYLKNVGESAIIADWLDSTTTANRIIVADNVIDTVTVAIFTATGMELIGNNFVVTGNVVRNCGADGISMRGTNFVCTGNQCFNNAQSVALSSGIVFLYDGTDVLAVQGFNIVIANNTASDDQASPTQVYGIRLSSVNGGSVLLRALVTGNVVWRNVTADITVDDGIVLDASNRFRENTCWPDYYSANATVTSPANTSRNVLNAYGVPPQSLLDNGSIKLECSGNITGTNNTKTIEIVYGGTTCASTVAIAGTTGEWSAEVLIANKNLRNSQVIASKVWVNKVLVVSSTQTAAENSNAVKSTYMAVTLANASDAVTCERFVITRQ
jgi:hypothetical protein